MAGPTPMRAPAATIIRSSKSRSLSLPSLAGACWCVPAKAKASARRSCSRRLCRSAPGSASPSLHITFLTEQEWQLGGELGFLKRTDQQFHWQNEGYSSFDEFLGALASRKRKAVRKERREALTAGIDDRMGDRASSSPKPISDAFFAFYMDTGSRKWGTPYLTRECFSLLRDSMADKMLLVLAKRAGRYIAGALNFIGADTLYGRYWGGIEDHPFLHFEICYYQAIDFAIAAQACPCRGRRPGSAQARPRLSAERDL